MSGALSLKARFPYMFAGQHAGLTFYRGWTPVLARVSVRIDAILPAGKLGFRWVQIRADQGCGFFVYTLARRQALVLNLQGNTRRALAFEAEDLVAPPVAAELDLLVLDAERVTSTACMVCGHRAELGFHFGCAVTFCERHTPASLNLRGEEGLEGFWRESIEWEEVAST
ncbi:hypothetical protein WKW77_24530 [Variovorax ureilyticus]|uniref:DUF4178 domain-containing protein n=1 Tax=Variovorax ureilyticus TaxID=1836198 RepID=A0ABU8VKS3_9BURK